MLQRTLKINSEPPLLRFYSSPLCARRRGARGEGRQSPQEREGREGEGGGDSQEIRRHNEEKALQAGWGRKEGEEKRNSSPSLFRLYILDWQPRSVGIRSEDRTERTERGGTLVLPPPLCPYIAHPIHPLAKPEWSGGRGKNSFHSVCGRRNFYTAEGRRKKFAPLPLPPPLSPQSAAELLWCTL